MKPNLWPRRDWKTLFANDATLRRRMHCEGVVAIMAREGIDVDIQDVYDYYDKVIVPNRGKTPL